MRKLIYAINVTLDGCCDHTKTIGGDEILEYFTQLIERLTCRSLGVKPIN